MRLFRRLGFTAKAVIISLAFMLPMLGLLGWTLQNQSEQALQARHDALRQQVQLAHGLLVWAHAQESRGQLTRAQAQQLALQALRPLQHDGGEGFWVQRAAVECAAAGRSLPPRRTTLSHVMGFAPWGWILGSGVPVDDLQPAPGVTWPGWAAWWPW